MKKIMFYCQNLLGMGHLVRTTEIIRSLVKDFQVCLIEGGQTVEGFEIPPEVEVVKLPAIRVESKQIKTLDSSLSLEEVQQIRREKILRVYDQFQPDCLILEGYPFSKKKSLAFEVVPLLERIQATGRLTKIVCSLRDIIMVKQYRDRAESEIKRCAFVNQYFDLLLVHSDPQIHLLEENFSQRLNFTCQVDYTGYVVQSPPLNLKFTPEDVVALNYPEPKILVTVGGGRLGHDLLDCVMDTAAILQEDLPHQFQVFTGPFIPQAKFTQLEKLAATSPNITLRRYTPHLLTYMENADLSISLGGYNTTMNVLRTRVNAMIYPSNKDSEQMIRAEKLAKRGILQVLYSEDLQSDRLARKIIASLQKKPAADIWSTLELQGAKKTAQLLQDLLSTQVTPAAACLKV